MVSIDERLEQLQEEEKKAKELAGFPIPKRTFRGGVGKTQQDEALNIRKQGKKALKDIISERQALLKARADFERQKAEAAKLEEKRQALEVAQKLADKAARGENVNIAGETTQVKKFFLLSDKARTAQFFALKQKLDAQESQQVESGGTQGQSALPDGATVSESLFRDILDKAAKGDVVSQRTLQNIGGVVRVIETQSTSQAETGTPLKVGSKPQPPVSEVTKAQKQGVTDRLQKAFLFTPIGAATTVTVKGIQRLRTVVKENLQNIFTEKRINAVSTVSISDIFQPKTKAGKFTKVVLIPPVREMQPLTTKAASGGTAAIIRDIRDEPEKQLLLLGAGRVVATGIRTTNVAIQSFTLSRFGVTAFRVSKVGTTGAEILGGVGLLGLEGTKTFLTAREAETPEQAAGVTTLFLKDLTLFGVGAATSKGSILQKQERFVGGVSAQLTQAKKLPKALVQKDIITIQEGKTLKKSLTKAIDLEIAFRRTPDVPITKKIGDILPSGLTPSQRLVFKETILTEGTQLFGSKALEIRGIGKGSDIDIAAIDNLNKLSLAESQLKAVSPKGSVRRRGEAIGLSEDKAFDIKDIARLEKFALKEKPVKTDEGLSVIKTSEQFSRAVSGVFELRKGGKDIKSVVLAGRALIEQYSLNAGKGILSPLKKIKARNLEKKLIEVEKTIPIIKEIKPRLTGEELPKLPKRLGFLTDEPPLFKDTIKVSPLEFAERLSQKQEINFFRNDPFLAKDGALGRAIIPRSKILRPEIEISDIFLKSKLKAQRLYKSGRLSKNELRNIKKSVNFEEQKTIAHELIHLKTPKIIRDTPLELLPYRFRPSEVIAFKLEKKLAVEGFKIKSPKPLKKPFQEVKVLKESPKKTLTESSRFKTGDIKPSEFKPSKIKPSRFKPSLLFPSAIKPSKFEPSKLKPSKITPSKVPPPSIIKTPPLTPSRFKPSKFDPPSIVPPPTTPPPSLIPPTLPPRRPPKRPPSSFTRDRRLRTDGVKTPKRKGEDLFLVEGFTAKTLGIKQEIKLKDIEKIAKKQSAIAIRPTPIIIK